MNPLNNLKKLQDTPLLPADRKEFLRKNLLAHMQALPLGYSYKISLWQRLNRLFSRPLSVVLASLLLIIAAGAGAAAAASKALPGQVLYAIKTGINEPVKAALMVRAADRAIYETELAAKRIEEAQTLAAAGQLDETTQTKLSADFDDHIEEVRARVQNNQTDHFNEVQALLDQAQTKLKNHDYKAAAELGRQASAAAHNRSPDSSNETPAPNPSVKGESTGPSANTPANSSSDSSGHQDKSIFEKNR